MPTFDATPNDAPASTNPRQRGGNGRRANGVGRAVHPKPPAASAMEAFKQHLKSDRVTRMALTFLDRFEGVHLKDEVMDWMDDQRGMSMLGQKAINFGCDSFLGLDRDPRLRKAMQSAAEEWGTHNGASRAFVSVELCEEAERRLARWLGVENTLIYPSVTLANAGLLPAVVNPGDLLIVDRNSHDSIHQGSKIAAAEGAVLKELPTSQPAALRDLLDQEKGLEHYFVVAIDGVYSMSGRVPPLQGLYDVSREYGGALYIDDAHGTGVAGPGGRGAAYEALGDLNDVLAVGSLSKGFSCMGAFVTCTTELRRILKIRSSTFIFGGPVPPPYLAAICTVCDILESPEYDVLRGRLDRFIKTLTEGLRNLDLIVQGGQSPIISVLVGEIEKTLEAGKWLFDRGYYVQSATFPAVPINGGLLRIQVNANHSDESIDGLLNALSDMKTEFRLPTASTRAT